MESVTLIDRRDHRARVHLEAEIRPGGDLLLSGQDLGPFVEEHWGDSDYEYWVTVKREHLGRLAALLGGEGGGGPGEGEVLPLLRRAYETGRFTDSSGFMEWLKENGVPYEFSSYA